MRGHASWFWGGFHSVHIKTCPTVHFGYEHGRSVTAHQGCTAVVTLGVFKFLLRVMELQFIFLAVPCF